MGAKHATRRGFAVRVSIGEADLLETEGIERKSELTEEELGEGWIGSSGWLETKGSHPIGGGREGRRRG